MRLKTVLHLIGALLVALSACMVLTLMVSVLAGDGIWRQWMSSSILTMLSGIGLLVATGSAVSPALRAETSDAVADLGDALRKLRFRERPEGAGIGGELWRVLGLVPQLTRPAEDLRRSEGFAAVSIGWVAMAVFGTIPFLLSGSIPSITDAFFETMSGFTTTGASILTDIEALSPSILFWRSLTHWIGGMGIIVLSLAILPFLGVGGMQLFRAEVPGPAPDRLQPRITETAKLLWGVYVALTVVEIVLLMIAGMPLLDSCCHAFGTLGTGGFSTKNASIGAYDSLWIHWIIIVFMLFAGSNFTLHFAAFRDRSLRGYLRDVEFRVYAFMMVATILTVAGVVYFGDTSRGAAGDLSSAAFTVAAMSTSTGYTSVDYEQWPFLIHAILLVLMFVGGCAGSTGGGFKLVRALLLVRFTRIELRRLLHPRAVISVKYSARRVPEPIIQNVLGFFLLYMIFLTLGAFALTLFGIDLLTAGSASLACLSNIGPGLAGIGPTANYAWMPDAAKWLLAAWMLLGRLEIYTVLIFFAPELWRR